MAGAVMNICEGPPGAVTVFHGDVGTIAATILQAFVYSLDH
jgi:hypothetical protein